MKKLFIVLLVAMLAVSCTKDSDPPIPRGVRGIKMFKTELNIPVVAKTVAPSPVPKWDGLHGPVTGPPKKKK